MTAVKPQAGDLVFCHSKGIIGGGIRLIERFRREWDGVSEAPGGKYNHVAILDAPATGDDWWIIQAEASGVTNTGLLSTVAPGGYYTIVHLPDGVNRAKVLEFARSQVGYEYGFVSDACILLTLFSPRFVHVGTPFTWICSALAGECLRAGGWCHSWGDIYQVTPAQLWVALDTSSVVRTDYIPA